MHSRECENETASALAPMADAGRGVRKRFIVLLVLAIVATGLLLSHHRGALTRLRELTDEAGRSGPLAIVWFGAGVAALVCFGFPRLPLCTAGGMAFGFTRGLVAASLGTLAGYYAVFLFVRWGGRGVVARHCPRLLKASAMLQSAGTPAVILLRQIPIYGGILNLVLGLSSVRHSSFLLGTAIGLIPESIPFALMGSGMTHASPSVGVWLIAGAVIVFAVGWLAVKAWMSRQRSKALIPEELVNGLREG